MVASEKYRFSKGLMKTLIAVIAYYLAILIIATMIAFIILSSIGNLPL
jgi:hypothetical protein